MRVDERQQMSKVSFRAAFAQQDVHAEPQLLARFLDFNGLVIRAHAGKRVSIEIFSAQAGRMAVNRLALANFNFRQFAFRTEIDAGEIHEFSDARDPLVGDHQLQIVGGQFRAGGFQMRRRNAAWQHDEKIHGQIFGGCQNVADAVEAQDVRVFVRVNDDRAGAVWHDRPRKFRRGEHRTLNVKMPVNQARREISALEINDLLCLIVAKADDTTVLDGDVRLVNFPAQNIDDAGVFEKQFGALFAARDG